MSPEPFTLSFTDERPRRYWFEVLSWDIPMLPYSANHDLRVEIRDDGLGAWCEAVYLRRPSGKLRRLRGGDVVTEAGHAALRWYRDWRRGETC